MASGTDDTGVSQNFSAEAYYFSRLAEGSFQLPRCADCNRYHFYPRLVCPYCGSNHIRWEPAGGTGTVYSTTVVRGKRSEHNVCLVDLDEGPRLMSTVINVSPTEVVIGQRVRAAVEYVQEGPRLVFEQFEEGR